MALTINSVILNQQANSELSYCYLYEPLRIKVVESEVTSRKMYIDIERYSIADKTLVDSFIKYAEFDINIGKGVVFDLMEITQQLHKAELYKFSDIQDFKNLDTQSVVSKYYYKYKIYTDVTTTSTDILKLPIIGGRDFSQFTAAVTETSPLTEFDYYSLDKIALQKRWGATDFLQFGLSPLSGLNYLPTISNPTGGNPFGADGGIVYFKSRFGGWMFWGFDILRKSFSHSYTGDVSVGMFESTTDNGGKPYIPVDYTSITTNYSLELKALSLTTQELRAVAGISSSPAVYYADSINGRFELMRIASVSAPYSNIAKGGDFSLSLKNISSTIHKTM